MVRLQRNHLFACVHAFVTANQSELECESEEKITLALNSHTVLRAGLFHFNRMPCRLKKNYFKLLKEIPFFASFIPNVYEAFPTFFRVDSGGVFGKKRYVGCSGGIPSR